MTVAPTHPKVTEAEIQVSIVELAQTLGWRVAHFRPALTGRGWTTAVQGDGAGFPDLVMCRGIRLLFAELKSERGSLSNAQQGWLNALWLTTAEVHIWRPADWFDGTVQRVLEGRVEVVA